MAQETNSSCSSACADNQSSPGTYPKVGRSAAGKSCCQSWLVLHRSFNSFGSRSDFVFCPQRIIHKKWIPRKKPRFTMRCFENDNGSLIGRLKFFWSNLPATLADNKITQGFNTLTVVSSLFERHAVLFRKIDDWKSVIFAQYVSSVF